jgi:hypothetical protein
MAFWKVTDYPEFQRFAAASHSVQAQFAGFGIEWRAEAAYRADRTQRDYIRLPRPRFRQYAEFLADEVARACSSRLEFVAAAREAQARHEAAEQERRLRRPWPQLAAEFQQRSRTSRVPARSATRSAPAVSAPAARAVPAAGSPVDPVQRRIAELKSKGFAFTAERERRELAAAQHRARRAEVEAEVAATERLFSTLCRNFGEDYATRYMEGA